MASRFTQADVTRAVKAAEKAGLCVSRVKIGPDGTIELVAGSQEAAENTNWFAGSPLYKDVA